MAESQRDGVTSSGPKPVLLNAESWLLQHHLLLVHLHCDAAWQGGECLAQISLWSRDPLGWGDGELGCSWAGIRVSVGSV